MANRIQRLMSANCGRERRLRFCLVISFVLMVGATAFAQSAARPDRGVRPTGSYALSNIENVNMTNGNLNVSIPLASMPPMSGGKISWTLNAIYNSKMWDMYRVEEEDTSTVPATRFITNRLQLGGGGWSIGGRYRIEVSESRQDTDWRDPLCDFMEPPQYCDPDWQLLQQHPGWYKVSLITPDGAVHELRPLDGSGQYPGFTRDYLLRTSRKTPATTGNTMTYYTYDGSYLWAAIQPWNPFNFGQTPPDWDVYMPDGTRIENHGNTQWITDTNGNTLRIRSTTSGMETTTAFRDFLTGREIKVVYNQAVNPPYGQGRVEYQTVGGDWVTTYINLTSTTVSGWAYEIGDPVCADKALLLNTDITVIDSIVLPATEPGITRQFSFDYNSDTSVMANYQWRGSCGASYEPVTSMSKGLGSLSQITMPSGAVVKYSYLWDQPETSLINSALNPADFPGDAVIKKEVLHDGAPPEVWNYSASGQVGISSVSGPDGSVITENAYPHDRAYQFTHGGLDGKGGLTYRTKQSDRVVVERKWRLNSLNGMAEGSTGSAQLVPFNPVVDMEFTTLMDPPGTPKMMAAKEYEYNLNGNVTSTTEYDWIDLALVTVQRDAQGVPTEVPAGTPILRVLNNTYYNEASDQSSPNVYHKRVNGTPPMPLILNAPKESTVSNSTTTLSKVQFSYDSFAYDTQPPTKGNLTQESRWLIEESRWLQTSYAYDTRGNLTSTTDPRGNVTTLVYDAATFAQPISVTVDPDPLVTGDELTTATIYDFSTGLVKSQTDVNGQVTSIDYTNQRFKDANQTVQDPFYRPGVVTAPAVDVFDPSSGQVIAAQVHTTVTRYYDTDRQVETRSDLQANGDGKLRSRATADQIGRVVLSESSEDGGATYGISSQMVYQQMGRITFSSNPKRTGSTSTDGWTRATRDDAGRVIEVATFSGASQPASTGYTNSTGYVTSSYNADTTTVVDQAGKRRRSIVDGLGRLTQVDELNETGTLYASTFYQYDALNNLRRVQQGTQNRYFIYDSLSRLLRSRNPEQNVNTNLTPALSDPLTGNSQWNSKYTYDDNSNLKTRIEARNITTTYDYDGLNRVKKRTYTNDPQNTPQVTYTYENAQIPFSKGRLTKVSNSISTTDYTEFDALGRIKKSTQTTAGTGQAYEMSYGYNLAGAMTYEKYPSGREVFTSYDSAGRLSQLEGQRTNNNEARKTYASSFAYTAHGAVASMKLGTSNPRYEHANFNSRLQPTQIGLGTSATDSSTLQLDYTYGTRNASGVLDTTKNNGNIESQTLSAPKTSGGSLVLTQFYTYDQCNRLLSAAEKLGTLEQWRQAFAYDRFGNRTFATGTTPDVMGADIAFATDTTTNRITTAGYGYDWAGNVEQEPATPTNKSYTYDAENHQLSFSNGATTQYAYDGDGRRVRRINADSTSTVFVYNAGGQLLAEYVSGAPQPVGGGGTSYLTSDHLGSTRVVSKSDGSVKARYDFLPFGEELSLNRSSVAGYGGADSTKQKFTGHELDEESKLHFMQARYCSSATGRFMSFDPLIASARSVEPQSWNQYSYVINNPLKYIDPTGLDWWYRTGLDSATPEWHDSDPGKGYARWTDLAGYVYRDSSGNWWALNPNKQLAYLTDSSERAEEQFSQWAGSGLIGATLAQKDWLGGFNEGVSGLFFGGWLNALAGLDTTSRDYEAGLKTGVLAGAIAGGTGGVIRGLTASSKAVAAAEKAIKRGATSVTVDSADEAAEVFLHTYQGGQGPGYRNTTGMTGNQVRNDPFVYPTGKSGTYHWDLADTQHGGIPHLQVHKPDGTVVRIFFKVGS